MNQIKENYRGGSVPLRGHQTSLQSTISNLRNLKKLIEEAIPDEQAAQKMYEKGKILANYVGMSYEASVFDTIGRQERNHEIVFDQMLLLVEEKIKEAERRKASLRPY